ESVMFCFSELATTEFFSLSLHDALPILGFLSFVAASCILGSQFVLIADNYQIGIYFLILGLASGIIFTYLLLAILIEKRNKPSFQAINGSWLLLVVAM